MAEGWLAHQGGRLAEARALDARPDLAAQLEARDRTYLGACGAREEAAMAEREKARENELARAKAEADEAIARARFSRNSSRVVGIAAILLAVVAIASIALGVLAKREATRAEESYQIARHAADSLVVDIAQGLRNVEGMPTASVKCILETTKNVIDGLASSASDDIDLRTSHVLMLGQFATNYAAIGDLGTALEYAESSVREARAILASRSDAPSMRLLGANLIALGRVQTARGDTSAARAAFEEAVDVGGQIAAAAPGDTSAQRTKAQALIWISDLDVMRGDMTSALNVVNASVAIARALSVAEPSNREWQRLLADGLERSGNIDGRLTTAVALPRLDLTIQVDQTGIDYPTALANYEDARKIFRAVAAADPTNTDDLLKVENILIRIGDLNIATKNLADALSAHKEALAISSDLLANDSGNVLWKRIVEVNYQKLQSVYSAQGDLDAALTAAQDSLEIAKRLIDINPRNLLWRRDLCGRYRALAVVLRNKGDEAGAVGDFDKAVAICRETASLYPSESVAKIELIVTLYRASAGRPPDKAAPLLREALKLLEDLEHTGALPKAAANWASLIHDKIDKPANDGAAQ
jgi:tetratricopeptide (TPR) repeat protein